MVVVWSGARGANGGDGDSGDSDDRGGGCMRVRVRVRVRVRASKLSAVALMGWTQVRDAVRVSGDMYTCAGGGTRGLPARLPTSPLGLLLQQGHGLLPP